LAEDRNNTCLIMSTAAVKRDMMIELGEILHQSRSVSPDQQQAWEALKVIGLPGHKTEEYKFTPVVRFLEKVDGLQFGSGQTTTKTISSLVPALPCNLIAFDQGKYSTSLSSLIDTSLRVYTRPVSPARGQQDPFELLNLALATEELVLEIPAGVTITHPIVIAHTPGGNSNRLFMPRLFCQIGREATVTLVEHGTDGPLLNNGYTHLAVGENAQVEYILIQDQANDIQLCHTHLDIEANARAACFTFSFDGRLIRNNLTLSVNGSGVDAHLYGLYLASGKSHIDNHTVVDHRVANAYSNQLYKGIMDGQSKGVFNGKIYVRPDAQKTNAFQSNRNIILGEEASVNTKPQLEIWADDVKCSHGCTTGQLDEEALFYLQSRGIGKVQARALLLHAFAAETLKAMKHEAIRQYIEDRISTRLLAGM
jgi:Fe-S cluster assembly protein SufD